MSKEQDTRFNKLFSQYLLAYKLSCSLIDSGLLERRIKTGRYDSKKFSDILQTLTLEFANELRDHNIDEYDPFKGVVACEAYFAELKFRGSEWLHADLAEKFHAELRSSQDMAKDISENG